MNGVQKHDSATPCSEDRRFSVYVIQQNPKCFRFATNELYVVSIFIPLIKLNYFFASTMYQG